MLTPESCAERRRRLWKSLPAGTDIAVIADPQHLIYFANYAPSPFEFRSNESAAILLLEPERATLVGDRNLQITLEQAHVDEVVAPVWYDGLHSAPPRKAQVVRHAIEFLKTRPVHHLAIEAASAPAGLVSWLKSERPDVATLDLDPFIRPLRRAKDGDEIALLRRCLQASDAGMAAGLAGIEPGMTELDAYLLVQKAAIAAAGTPAIVYGDFVSGPAGIRTGGPPTDRVIARGDLVILDFSVVLHGYRGDVANTFVAGGGRATPRQRELFEACLAALAAGEALLRPGIACREVDAALRQVFRERGLEAFFSSHSGHGVGLGHPEPPFFVPESADVLAVGDVVTLEPGQYHPGVAGMRYERDYLIRPDGFEVLSEHRLTIER